MQQETVDDKKTFEENMARLEQIVSTLEKGDAPLEQSMTLFREGVSLAQTCAKTLTEAEEQIKKLMADGSEVDFGMTEDV